MSLSLQYRQAFKAEKNKGGYKADSVVIKRCPSLLVYKQLTSAERHAGTLLLTRFISSGLVKRGWGD